MAIRGSRSLRRGALALAGALSAGLLPAAPAHGWVEQAGYDLPGGAVAACLRAGGPGELTVLGELTRRTAATDLLRIAAGPEHEPARQSSTTLGWPAACPETIAAPGTPTLLAGAVHPRAPRSWVQALHVARPGERPARIPRPPRTSVGNLATASAPDGVAALAWMETRWQRDGDAAGPPLLMAAVRRSASGRFGPARVVAAEEPEWGAAPAIGVDARGRVSVAWIGSGGPADEEGRSPDDVIRLASARSDGSFARPRDLSGTWSEQVALAVAPNGRALLAAGAYDTQIAYERRPGARRFERVRLPYPGTPDRIAVAIDDRGGAAIVYENGAIWSLLRRPGERRFRDVPVHRPPEDEDGGTWSFGGSLGFDGPGPPDDPRGRDVHVRLGAGGTLVVTWTSLVDGEQVATAHAARGTLAGGFEPAAALSGQCRTANATTPVELPDGRIGVAWTDNAEVALVDGEDEATGGGRLHVARPDPPAAPPAPVALGVAAEVVPGESGAGAIRTGESLRLRVRCPGGACDVRALATALGVPAARDPDWPAGFGDPPAAAIADAAHLPAGAEATLELSVPSRRSLVAPGTTGAPEVVVTACTPSGPVVERVVLAPRLGGLPLRPRPRPLDLRARRRGEGIRVTWRTAAPALDVEFALSGTDARDRFVAGRSRAVEGDGRTRFAVTLRDPRRRLARVHVTAIDPEYGQGGGSADAPVRWADGVRRSGRRSRGGGVGRER